MPVCNQEAYNHDHPLSIRLPSWLMSCLSCCREYYISLWSEAGGCSTNNVHYWTLVSSLQCWRPSLQFIKGSYRVYSTSRYHLHMIFNFQASQPDLQLHLYKPFRLVPTYISILITSNSRFQPLRHSWIRSHAL